MSVVVTSVLGLILGIVIGSKVAFHENDGSTETLFIAGETSTPSPERPPFRIVTYDGHDQPTLRTIKYESIRLEDGQAVIPLRLGTDASGPWDGSGVLAEHEYQAGGLEFDASSDSVGVRLVLYPSRSANGWVREYYFYTVRDGLVTPLRMERERSVNGWGIEQVGMFAILGLGGGVMAGLLIWAMIATVSEDRRAKTE